MVVDAVVNIAYTFDTVFQFIPCATGMVDGVMERPDIFQCGHPRGTLLFILVFFVGFQICLLYPTWLYCKELEYSNSQENDKFQKMPSRQAAIAWQWAGFRKGPLDYIHGRMKGEHGAANETLKLIGAGFSQRVMDDQIPYLPAGKLV